MTVGRALVGLFLVAGCAAPTRPPAVSSAVPTRDPVAQCADRLLYWVDRIRTSPDASGLDYQEMGLTGSEFEELTKLEALPPDSGPPTEEATAACARLEALPTPSGGTGWPG